jgi:AraC family transcriptional regulator
MGWAGQHGLFGPGARFFGILYDDPEVTPPEKLRYDAAISLHRDIAPSGDIGIQEVGPGEYAVARHKGPYERLHETYARLCGEWLPASGRELISAPSLEVYLNIPQMTPPEELLTDIYLPLAGR